MKRYFILFFCLTIVALTLVSCGGDDYYDYYGGYSSSQSDVTVGSSVNDSEDENSSTDESNVDTSSNVDISSDVDASSNVDISSNVDTSSNVDISSNVDTSSSIDTSSSLEDEDNKEDVNPSQMDKIVLQTISTDVKVGDKITVKVVFNSLDAVKTVGLRPIFDEECFEFVSGKMLISGAISDFSNNIGVVAFDAPVNFDGQSVMQFVLRAKTQASAEAIGCEVSVKGVTDSVIVVPQPDDLIVEIK